MISASDSVIRLRARNSSHLSTVATSEQNEDGSWGD